ncbi:MAG: hypothetical protein B6U72_02195 [Candidatus Altiarchaeales archaeon ex4484_2]|nr:MAG: hypothetical protein B6U72_02195 [Candidatus Altiarchaeales archaeon ex4484_2]
MIRYGEVVYCLLVVFVAGISLGEPLGRVVSLSVVLSFLLSIILEVYRFPKGSVPVEEDLKKLDREGYPRR